MFFHSLLGIPLHLRIERRIDFQPIGINIILGSVSLHIFLAPTIQRIIRPSNGIVYEFLSFPPPIFRFHRLFCRHHQSQLLSEIRSQPLFMIHSGIFQLQRQSL